MKKFLLALMFVMTIGISIDADAQNPIRKVLYSFAPGESIFEDEIGLSFRLDDNKFAILTEQKKDSLMTLIINGEKILSAPWIYVHQLDMDQPANSVYQFMSKDGEKYITVGKETYGPYEDIRYISPEGLFQFMRMGMGFRHDIDGSIYPLISRAEDGIELLWYSYNEHNPIFSSKDGKHKIQLISGNCSVVYDGKEFILPFEKNYRRSTIDNVEFSESGNCGFYFEKDNRNYYNNNDRSSGRFAIINNKLIELDEQYFDAEKDRVVDYAELNYFDERPHMENFFENNYVGPLQDKSKRHLLSARWDYDYIMVDNQRFNVQPITIFYEEDDNMFGWVTIEGNQLVVYYYRL